jgi:hypothetical protein
MTLAALLIGLARVSLVKFQGISKDALVPQLRQQL